MSKNGTNAQAGMAGLDVMVAVDDLELPLQAYEAVRQIITPDTLHAEAYLPAVKRQDMAALLEVLNLSLDQRYQAARIAAKRASMALRNVPSTADPV